MITKTEDYFEARLYLGSIEGYKGKQFSEAQLTRVIQDFQTKWKNDYEWTTPVRITKTNFVCMDYQESGWEIVAINYPRFPKSESDISRFMAELQDHLMIEFGQNRTTVVYDGKHREIVMMEKENAEQTHK